ncbi:hypothetical protein PF005_g19412 [Phytophthora fragariae]|uniref:Uncharacterized protein n=1 Tax=Phytophthora fragariae TaxID=53985 RepID=A0A6A3WZ47_9STRA|nr:hypothetical protein PF009_g20371 [Phytophthora fragariae]KAE8989362.1 hypothetical protein PF011_g18806 [Phytophthora fragariae]KAE9088990.1 hypothetical protein PF010_g19172 [Phytophthora fragariae]KAE9089577.1 hypothetical protein PF007_g19549 [Phytophthora fragariae]KAE9119635.1 hypothetical protein PF006_g18321 [Phytophthora fragariae]
MKILSSVVFFMCSRHSLSNHTRCVADHAAAGIALAWLHQALEPRDTLLTRCGGGAAHTCTCYCTCTTMLQPTYLHVY